MPLFRQSKSLHDKPLPAPPHGGADLGSVFGDLLAVFRAKAPSKDLVVLFTLIPVHEKAIHDPYQTLARQLKVSVLRLTRRLCIVAATTYMSSTITRASIINLLGECQVALLSELQAKTGRIQAVHSTKTAMHHAAKMPDEALRRALERIKAYLLQPNPHFRYQRPPSSFCYYALVVQKQANFVPRHAPQTLGSKTTVTWVLKCHTCDKSLAVAPRGSTLLPGGKKEKSKTLLPANQLFDHLFKEHSDDDGEVDPDLDVYRVK
ncbi:hypothetical protein GQ53DRAFT_767515 [Thozetella sp. PMI_491]|nr:hypothetical protein GQ53DRAFT_767515 [Thozetella sp. PMI_491]